MTVRLDEHQRALVGLRFDGIDDGATGERECISEFPTLGDVACVQDPAVDRWTTTRRRFLTRRSTFVKCPVKTAISPDSGAFAALLPVVVTSAALGEMIRDSPGPRIVITW